MPESNTAEKVPKGGKSDYEIAIELGITRTAVYQIRKRAMEKLKRFALQDPELRAEFVELLRE